MVGPSRGRRGERLLAGDGVLREPRQEASNPATNQGKSRSVEQWWLQSLFPLLCTACTVGSVVLVGMELTLGGVEWFERSMKANYLLAVWDGANLMKTLSVMIGPSGAGGSRGLENVLRAGITVLVLLVLLSEPGSGFRCTQLLKGLHVLLLSDVACKCSGMLATGVFGVWSEFISKGLQHSFVASVALSSKMEGESLQEKAPSCTPKLQSSFVAAETQVVGQAQMELAVSVVDAASELSEATSKIINGEEVHMSISPQQCDPKLEEKQLEKVGAAVALVVPEAKVKLLSTREEDSEASAQPEACAEGFPVSLDLEMNKVSELEKFETEEMTHGTEESEPSQDAMSDDNSPVMALPSHYSELGWSEDTPEETLGGLLTLVQAPPLRKQIKAALAVCSFATYTSANALAIVRDGGVEIFTRLLRSPEPKLRAVAAMALANIAHCAPCRPSLLFAGCLPALVGLLSEGGECSKSAAAALANMARCTSEGSSAVIQAGAVLPLSWLLVGSCLTTQTLAAGAIRNLSASSLTNRAAMAEGGLFQRLGAVLEGDNAGAQAQAIWSVANLCEVPPRDFGEMQASLRAILSLSCTADAAVKDQATWALSVMSQRPMIRRQMRAMNCVC